MSSEIIHSVITYSLQTMNPFYIQLSLALWKEYYNSFSTQDSSTEKLYLFSFIPNLSLVLRKMYLSKDIQLQVLSIHLQFIAMLEPFLTSAPLSTILPLLPNENDFCSYIEYLLKQKHFPLSLFTLLLQFAFSHDNYLEFLCSIKIPSKEDENKILEYSSIEVTDIEEEKEYQIIVPAVIEVFLRQFEKLSHSMQLWLLMHLLKCSNRSIVPSLPSFLIKQIHSLLPTNPIIRRLFIVTNLRNALSTPLHTFLNQELLFLVKQYDEEKYIEKDPDDLNDEIYDLIEDEMKSIDISLLPYYSMLICKVIASRFLTINCMEDLLDIIQCTLLFDCSSDLIGYFMYIGMAEAMKIWNDTYLTRGTNQEKYLITLFSSFLHCSSILPFLPYISTSTTQPVQFYSTCYHYAPFSSSKYELLQQMTTVEQQLLTVCNGDKEVYPQVDLFATESSSTQTHQFIPQKDIPFICQECGFAHLPLELVYPSSTAGCNPALYGDLFTYLFFYEGMKEMGTSFFSSLQNNSFLSSIWTDEKGNLVERSILLLCDLIIQSDLEDPFLITLLTNLQSVSFLFFEISKEIPSSSSHGEFVSSLELLIASTLFQFIVHLKDSIQQLQSFPDDSSFFEIADLAVNILYKCLKKLPTNAYKEMPSSILSTRLKQRKQRNNGIEIHPKELFINSEYDFIS